MHSQTVQEVQLTNLFLSSAVVQLMMIIDLQTYMLYNTHSLRKDENVYKNANNKKNDQENGNAKKMKEKKVD